MTKFCTSYAVSTKKTLTFKNIINNKYWCNKFFVKHHVVAKKEKITVLA